VSRPLCSEVAHAIRQTASRKATGPDEVLAELFKAGETVPDKKHRIYLRSGKLVSGQRNGRSGHSSHFPRKVIFDWSANYRTIALVSRASKIPLWIILERIRVQTKTEIADKQVGFRQAGKEGDKRPNQITNLRILMHKARKHQQPRVECLLEVHKAHISMCRRIFICAFWTLRRRSNLSIVISSG